MTTVTTRIDEETQSRLDQLAKATDRSRSWGWWLTPSAAMSRKKSGR